DIMETPTMGKVFVTAEIESLEDLYVAGRGLMPPEQVRRIQVTDALVDTGATSLSIPKRLITQLGLQPVRKQRARTTAGVVEVQLYGAVRLTIQGRECTCDVAEVPDDCPVLIGQLPLEALDFVVDPKGQRLIGNPAHGGEHMIHLF